MLDLVVEMGGSISAEHGIGVAKRAAFARSCPPGDLAAMHALKRALDPGADPQPRGAVPPMTSSPQRWADRGRRGSIEAGRRHPRLGVAVAVQRRFGAERGANLAAAISMRAFLSLFPVLVLAIAVVGFVGGDPRQIANDIVDASSG